MAAFKSMWSILSVPSSQLIRKDNSLLANCLVIRHSQLAGIYEIGPILVDVACTFYHLAKVLTFHQGTD